MELLNAHWRYANVIDLPLDGIPPEVVAADKAQFPHFIKRDVEHNCPKWVDRDCVEFMAHVSGLPKDWCWAWMNRDFIEPLSE